MNEGATREVGCIQVGRVVNDRLGVLGQDGSFNNDGKFHELPVQPDACGGLDARRQLFVDAAPEPRAASGDPATTCSATTGACPTRGRRTLTYGLAGELAQHVTATNATTHQSMNPIAGDNGAYLFVMAGDARQQPQLKVQANYPNALVCDQGSNHANTPGCSPPPGYVAQ